MAVVCPENDLRRWKFVAERRIFDASLRPIDGDKLWQNNGQRHLTGGQTDGQHSADVNVESLVIHSLFTTTGTHNPTPTSTDSPTGTPPTTHTHTHTVYEPSEHVQSILISAHPHAHVVSARLTGLYRVQTDSTAICTKPDSELLKANSRLSRNDRVRTTWRHQIATAEIITEKRHDS